MGKRIKVTLTFPEELWEELKRFVPRGERSRLVAEATEKELISRKRLREVRRLKALQGKLRKKYSEQPPSAEEIRALREERDARITDMR